MFIGLLAILLALILIVGLIAFLVVFYIGLCKVYTKAGQEGWKSIIPYYNNWVLMVDICDMHAGYFIASIAIAIVSGFLSFISTLLLDLEVGYGITYVVDIFSWILVLVSYGINFATYYNLGKKFNKGTGWVILTFFFGFITIPILGFSKNEVFTDVEVSKHSLFGSIGK